MEGIANFFPYDTGKKEDQQARKSSEDAQAAGYAQFEQVWAG